jgi:SpoU rRNA methylase family enzyme
MCHFYIKDIDVNNFHNFKLPKEAVYHSHNARKFNDFIDLLNPSNVLKIKNEQQENLNKIEELKKEKIILIDTIKDMYTKEDINFILSKLEFNENIINGFKNKEISIKI